MIYEHFTYAAQTYRLVRFILLCLWVQVCAGAFTRGTRFPPPALADADILPVHLSYVTDLPTCPAPSPATLPATPRLPQHRACSPARTTFYHLPSCTCHLQTEDRRLILLAALLYAEERRETWEEEEGQPYTAAGAARRALAPRSQAGGRETAQTRHAPAHTTYRAFRRYLHTTRFAARCIPACSRRRGWALQRHSAGVLTLGRPSYFQSIHLC